MKPHAYRHSNPAQFDSNCAVCGGKGRDSVHGATDEARAKSAQSREDWVGEIYAAVEQQIEVTRSDAQGIVDGQAFVLAQQWAMDSTPEDAARAIIKSATK